MQLYSLLFTGFEIFLFILPIIPSNFYLRLLIGILYYISHILKVNIYYARFKYYVLHNNTNREDDSIDYSKYIAVLTQCIGVAENTESVSLIHAEL